MNTQIAIAAEEQTTVAEEIYKNIVSIYTLADQTASYAKKSTNTASEIASLADHFAGLVTRFKVR